MKKRKIFLLTAILLLTTFLFTSCNATDSMSGGGGGFAGGSLDFGSKGESIDGSLSGSSPEKAPSGTESDKAESDSDDSADSKEESDGSEVINRPAGLITAAAWNDNDNYEYWKTLFMQAEGETAAGKFFGMTGDNSWGFNSFNRIKVTVKHGEEKIAGAYVVAKDANQSILFSAVTDANGVAYLFTDAEFGEITVASSESITTVPFTKDERELTVECTASNEKQNLIELMFVVDVTGSMGDELEYLKNEIADVVARVAANNANTKINLALLFYRDTTDREQFKYHDFVDVTASGGIDKVIAAIDSQSATGGGDYPEAVDKALEMAANKQWSTGATTKIIFQILDAPPHSTATNKTTFKKAVDTAAEKGIRICPIICSGAETLTEYLMREAAIYTGGTFVFVTDDSGIGNSHHDPDLPNVTVEALNSLMVRLINGYHTGEFEDPVNWREEAPNN